MDKETCKSWDDAKKSALVAQIVSGKLSVKAACERHDLSPESIQEWVRVFRRTTLQAFDEHLRQMFLIQGADAAALGTAEYTGTLDDIPVGDLIQTFQMGGKGGVITITHEGQRSHIWCDKGEIVDAESGALRGAAAIYRILSFEQGQVLADFRSEPRERTVELPANVLLLEAARRQDECRRVLDRLGGERTVYRHAATPTAPANRVERQLLGLCDGTRNLREVLEQSDAGDLETLQAVAGLVERRQLQRYALSSAPKPLATAIAVSADTPPAVSFLPLVASQAPAPTRRPPSPLAFVGVGMAFGILVWVGSSLVSKTMPAPARGVAALAPAAPGEGAARTFAVDSSVTPGHAELWLDGVKVGAGRLQRQLPRDGTPHALRIVAAGYAPTTLLFVDAPPPGQIALEPLSSPSAPPLGATDAPGSSAAELATAPALAGAPRSGARKPNPPPRIKRVAAPPKAVEPDGTEAAEAAQAKVPRVQIIEDDVPVVEVIE
jgi:hypothetical protein